MWYINRKKQDELVQAIWLGEGAWANNCWGVKDKDDNWLGCLKDADFQSQYGEAMICSRWKECPYEDCDAKKAHIKLRQCSLAFCETDNWCGINCPCIPYIPKQKQADEEPVFPICGTCNVRKNSKPDSSLLLSDEEIKAFVKEMGWRDNPAHLADIISQFKAFQERLLNHLAKLGGKVWYCTEKHKCKWQCFALNAGLAWGEVVDTLDAWRQYHDKECTGKLIQCIAIPLSDYMKEKENEQINRRTNNTSKD